MFVRIRRWVGGNVGRMIAAERKSDAAIAPREIAHLRLPRAPVAGELVPEQKRRAAAPLLVMQAHVVAGGGEGHRRSPAVVEECSVGNSRNGGKMLAQE